MQALLVSRDAEAVSVLQRVMHDLDVESEVCAELQPAVERLAQGATSAVVVDYDVEHASELLKLMRQNYAGSCVALAMVKGLASIQAAYDMGANFVLIKPVSAAAASRSLGEATALVERMTHRPARPEESAHMISAVRLMASDKPGRSKCRRSGPSACNGCKAWMAMPPSLMSRMMAGSCAPSKLT